MQNKKVNFPDSVEEISRPIRVQRKRTKGFKLPDNTVCVTRGTNFGNPIKVGGWFKVGERFGTWLWIQAAEGYQDDTYTFVKDNETAVRMYKEMLDNAPYKIEKIIEKLKGKNLACYCKIGDICHADILLEIANRPSMMDKLDYMSQEILLSSQTNISQ